ncbi:PRTRC system protein B [Pseudomonas saponiphila]|jgi:PRTRC genetic system protein B|uniref:PRTRC system protein B n=1 Tax=Pseudomonas saponiphila TaxID=556534 RepID=A0A1H4ZTH1_9PSED|nr:hypothetical protein [Pseudomonas saponiphila]SED33392.1 PRTRC system protein B [Pseudomonas saponiphila]
MINAQTSSIAMLVHQHCETKNVDITTHPILPVDGGQFTLGAGRAMTLADKDALIAILLNEQPEPEFLDDSLLVCSRSTIVWYRKPAIVDIPFHDGVVKAPIPGLIFIAMAGENLRCFAFKGRSRPTPETRLFYAPFGNVYSGGTFCTGNAHVPATILRSNIPAWENFVLGATNTHAGTIHPVTEVDSIGALMGFYQSLVAAGKQQFPSDRMVSYRTHKTYQHPHGVHITLGMVLGGAVE